MVHHRNFYAICSHCHSPSLKWFVHRPTQQFVYVQIIILIRSEIEQNWIAMTLNFAILKKARIQIRDQEKPAKISYRPAMRGLCPLLSWTAYTVYLHAIHADVSELSCNSDSLRKKTHIHLFIIIHYKKFSTLLFCSCRVCAFFLFHTYFLSKIKIYRYIYTYIYHSYPNAIPV